MLHIDFADTIHRTVVHNGPDKSCCHLPNTKRPHFPDCMHAGFVLLTRQLSTVSIKGQHVRLAYLWVWIQSDTRWCKGSKMAGRSALYWHHSPIRVSIRLWTQKQQHLVALKGTSYSAHLAFVFLTMFMCQNGLKPCLRDCSNNSHQPPEQDQLSQMKEPNVLRWCRSVYDLLASVHSTHHPPPQVDWINRQSHLTGLRNFKRLLWSLSRESNRLAAWWQVTSYKVQWSIWDTDKTKHASSVSVPSASFNRCAAEDGLQSQRVSKTSPLVRRYSFDYSDQIWIFANTLFQLPAPTHSKAFSFNRRSGTVI